MSKAPIAHGNFAPDVDHAERKANREAADARAAERGYAVAATPLPPADGEGWIPPAPPLEDVVDQRDALEVTTPGRNAASCTRPPPGWLCSRGLNHNGPCAATRAKCEIPNASGAWLCDLEWGHVHAGPDGFMHSSAGDGYYARSFDAEHARRQLVRHSPAEIGTRQWLDAEQAAEHSDRRLDQAALRAQAQSTGGGVDERRVGAAQSLTDEELAAASRGRARRHAQPMPCSECKLTTTHRPGCTRAFGYVRPAPPMEAELGAERDAESGDTALVKSMRDTIEALQNALEVTRAWRTLFAYIALMALAVMAVASLHWFALAHGLPW